MSKGHPLARVRNIGIAAHVDAGKTTLTERILFYTGASHKIGEVHEGSAHMDYLAEEQQHGITITSAVTKAPWREHLLQIIDTPGHVDFTIEVERSMRILDGCVLVLDGVRGVEPQTETVWRQRSRFNLPVLFFVNKMDRPGADYGRALRQISKRLNAEPVAVTLPGPDQETIVDLIGRSLIRFRGDQGEVVHTEPCPDRVWSQYAPWRETLLLAVGNLDDSLAEQVLEGADPPADELRRVLRRGTLAGQLFPTYGGSALRNLGVQPLLDGIVDYLPAPDDRPPATAHRADGALEEVVLGGPGPLVALVFKVQLWEGRRHAFARVYRNRLNVGDPVAFLTQEGRVVKESVARLFDVDAGKKSRTESAGPGQIVLIAGLRHASTGDTLCDPGHLLTLERIVARRPVLSLAIEPAHGADSDKLLEVLDKLTQEDPTLQVEEDPETGQRLLKGMGELHLQIVLERLRREFHLEVRSGRPAVAGRETVRSAASAEVLFAPPLGLDPKAAERRARVAVRVRPVSRGQGMHVVNKPRVHAEGSEPSLAQLAAVAEGARSALMAGPIQGLPVEDVEVIVEEVELFGAASTIEALGAAAARAVHKAVEAAGPAMLHPVMAVEIFVPEANLGAVLGDLQARLGVILGTETQSDEARVTAEVPLEHLLGYTTTLRSLTQGRGQFSMQFARFDLV